VAVIGGVPFQNLEMRKARPIWTKATDPVLNVLPSIARHAGQAWESMGIAEPSLLDEHPSAPPGYRAARTVGKNLLGGFSYLMSPITGALESLWDKPVSENLQIQAGVPENVANQAALYSSLALPGVGFGGVVAKGPKAVKAVQKALKKKKPKDSWEEKTQQQIDAVKRERIVRPGEELWPISETGYGQPRGPQYPLERKFYKREKDLKVAEEEWDRLITPANIKKTIKHVDKGLSKGGFEWYDMEPLRYRFLDELGPEVGNQRFLEFVQLIGATSPGSIVPLNVKRASYFYHLLYNPRSKGPQDALRKWAQNQPPGYGHRYDRRTHQPLLKGIFGQPDNLGLLSAEAGMGQPKVSSFSHNIAGNLMPGTVDLHINRMLTGGIKQGSPEKLVYAHPEKVIKDIAEKKGLTTAQTQAAGWVDFMGGESRPLLILFEEAIKKTADKLGKTPDQVLKLWMNGKVPLASVLPMGATQLGTELADDIFGEKLIG